jgi:hypothetical protein
MRIFGGCAFHLAADRSLSAKKTTGDLFFSQKGPPIQWPLTDGPRQVDNDVAAAFRWEKGQ